MPGAASPSRCHWLLALLVCMAATLHAAAASVSEADVLLSFKETVTDDAGALRDWTPSPSGDGPCVGGRQSSWNGVYCEDGKVIKLVLENMLLAGALDVNALVGLPWLRTLSLMNNSFHGSLPAMRKLENLRSIYLGYNFLSGDIADDAFSGMGWLRVVRLEHNEFTGPIPASLAEAPRLAELSLEENGFSGALPDFRQGGQLELNVSYNRLQGAIPASLSGLQKSSFIGNRDLCGKPLNVPCPHEE